MSVNRRDLPTASALMLAGSGFEVAAFLGALRASVPA